MERSNRTGISFQPAGDGELETMASVCDVCGKKPSWGMSVSHSHRRTKRRWNPNVQRVRALVDGSVRRVNVCTGCIKSGKITKAVHTARARADA